MAYFERAEFWHRTGYTRIRGALSNLGHIVARSTIANILREHGIVPVLCQNSALLK